MLSTYVVTSISRVGQKTDKGKCILSEYYEDDKLSNQPNLETFVILKILNTTNNLIF